MRWYSPVTVANSGSTAILIALIVVSGCKFAQPPPAQTDLQRRGRHVLEIAGGCGCHGPNFAGWRAGGPDSFPGAAPYGERFVSADGIVPAPNITPDATGIDGWTDDQIAQAITDGVDPWGNRLSPVMPYRAYHGMAKSDLMALVAYLHCLRPVHNIVPAAQLKHPVEDLGPLPPAPQQRPADDIALGRYMVRNVSSCADCHAPAGSARDAPLSGGSVTIDGKEVAVPNITPDPRGGIVKWSEGEIARYLRTGSRPDGGLAQSAMAGLIVTSFSHYTPAEAHAVVAYLKSQHAVRNASR